MISFWLRSIQWSNCLTKVCGPGEGDGEGEEREVRSARKGGRKAEGDKRRDPALA